jgi:hypothetical protein
VHGKEGARTAMKGARTGKARARTSKARACTSVEWARTAGKGDAHDREGAPEYWEGVYGWGWEHARR